MTQNSTVTKIIQPPTKMTARLNIFELKTVKWVSDCYPISQTTKIVSTRIESGEKRFPLIRALYLMVQRIILSFIILINSLPWPEFMLKWVQRFDDFLENLLEATSNTVEWWFDYISVTLMRLKEFVIHYIEFGLSVAFFGIAKLNQIWNWCINFTKQILKVIFFPLFWTIGFIDHLLNPQKQEVVSAAKSQSLSKEASNINGISEIVSPQYVHNIPEEESRSTGSSEYESDVSVVSETWSTDKLGNAYNRREMKLQAEGKLREAMFKRVKTQLSLMRRNSVRFSEGMAAYFKLKVTPRLEPFASSTYEKIIFYAKKLRFLELYTMVETEISKRPWLAQLVSIYISLLLTPFAILSGIFGKHKSRRSRSVRSESLRRRLKAQEKSHPRVLSPSALRQSTEPVHDEADEQYQMTSKQKANSDIEEDTSLARDSALASSMDDLPSSDNGENGCCNLTDQVIEEEGEVAEISADKENLTSQKTKDVDQQQIEGYDETDSNKCNSSSGVPTIKVTNERNYAKILLKESCTPSNEKIHLKSHNEESLPSYQIKNLKKKASPRAKRKYNSLPKEEN